MSSFTFLPAYQSWNASAADVDRLLDLTIDWYNRTNAAYDRTEDRITALGGRREIPTGDYYHGDRNTQALHAAQVESDRLAAETGRAASVLGRVIVVAHTMTGEMPGAHSGPTHLRDDLEALAAANSGTVDPSRCKRLLHDIRNDAGGHDAELSNLAGKLYRGAYENARDRSVGHDREQAHGGPSGPSGPVVSPVSTKRLKPSRRKFSLFGGRKVDDADHAPTALQWQNIAAAQKIAVAKLSGHTLP